MHAFVKKDSRSETWSMWSLWYHGGANLEVSQAWGQLGTTGDTIFFCHFNPSASSCAGGQQDCQWILFIDWRHLCSFHEKTIPKLPIGAASCLGIGAQQKRICWRSRNYLKTPISSDRPMLVVGLVLPATAFWPLMFILRTSQGPSPTKCPLFTLK